MIDVLFHEADSAAQAAAGILAELARADLLEAMKLVEVGSEFIESARTIGGEKSDAGATPRLVAALATADLDPDGLRRLAEATDAYLGEQQNLAGRSIDGLRLYLPSYGGGSWPERLSGYFSPHAVNLVALPVDWVSPTAAAHPMVTGDAGHFAWHAALETATVSGAWKAVSQSLWRPQPVMAGVGETGVQFVRSMSRLVAVGAERVVVADDGVLPVPVGYMPSVVPERAGLAAASLFPTEFRIQDSTVRSGSKLRDGLLVISLRKALQSLFPVAGRGLRAGSRDLLEEWRGELSEATPDLSLSASHSDTAPDPAVAEDPPALLGFEPQLWSDLVRRALGVADGAPIAQQARSDAGGEAILFVNRASLLDDELETRLGEWCSTGEGAEDGERRPDETLAGGEFRSGPQEDRSSGAQRAGEAGGAAGPRGLLTLVGEQLDNQIAEARRRRAARDAELAELAALEATGGSTAAVQAPLSVRATAVAFVIVAFAVVASRVLLLDALGVGGLDASLRTALAVVATAVTWFVLAIPLAPSSRGPAAVQSYLMRLAAMIAVPAAGAIVFADQLALAASRLVVWEILSFVFIGLTGWLFYRVASSPRARPRPVARSLSLSWTVVFLTAGLFLYANMDDSVFQRWVQVVEFFERYGASLRNAAAIVAALLFILAVAMLTMSVGTDLRRAARIENRRRALRASTEGDRDVLRLLEALRINWLGTAAALDHVLRTLFRRRSDVPESGAAVEPPIARFDVRNRRVAQPPPDPGWIYGRYRAAADAFAADTGISEPPESSRLVSGPAQSPLAGPGEDPRWEFARRLRDGDYDSHISSPPGNWSSGLQREDLDFVRGIVPDRQMLLPLGQIGLVAAGLGQVEMTPQVWVPQESSAEAGVAAGVRSAEIQVSQRGSVAQSVRLDVSEPVPLSRLRELPATRAPAADLPEVPELPDDGGLF